MFAHRRGIDMEFQAARNMKAQLTALLLTFVVVGGAIIWATSAA